MGATRKFRNRQRNRTRGHQQLKLARRYVEREMLRQLVLHLTDGKSLSVLSDTGLAFRRHPQFGWCKQVLAGTRWTLVTPQPGHRQNLGHVLPV